MGSQEVRLVEPDDLQSRRFEIGGRRQMIHSEERVLQRLPTSGMSGKHHSEESRKRMSLSRIGHTNCHRTPALQRFFSHITIPSKKDCWLWNGPSTKTYPTIGIGSGSRKTQRVHVFSYDFF